MRIFRDLIETRWADNCYVCVGLDPDVRRIPRVAYVGGLYTPHITDTIGAFSRRIVEATADLACAFKPNIAFYARYGTYGAEALRRTIKDIFKIAPRVPIILDSKRGDIDATNDCYAIENFGFFEADACTVNPYLGRLALKPFIDRKDKGIFVLCRTSNTGAGEFQDLIIQSENIPLYRKVARNVADDWNVNGNCGLVVGATHWRELALVRQDVGFEIPLLIPGIGTQGGDLKTSVCAAKRNFIISSSRSIIYASSGEDFADAARCEAKRLHDDIQTYREDLIST